MAHSGRIDGSSLSRKISAILTVGLSLSACNQSLSGISPGTPPAGLPSAPIETVNSNQLPPIGGAQNSEQANAENPVAETAPTAPEAPAQQIASADENQINKSTREITREGMAGSWKVPTDGGSCNIILAFTKWSGGYRAATRHCSSTEIQSVSAWDVKDQSVVLVDQSGNQVARLFASNEGRYDGRTNGGNAIAFTR